MQDVDFSSAIQSAWLGWEHGCKIELNLVKTLILRREVDHLGAAHSSTDSDSSNRFGCGFGRRYGEVAESTESSSKCSF